MTSPQQALDLLRTGRLPEAEQLYLEILQSEPANAAAYHFLGIVRFQQGRYPEALEGISASLKLHCDPAVLASQGNMLQALGRLEEALASYDQALRIEPGLVTALYNRGVTLCAMKRNEEALASYDCVLAIDPGDTAAWLNRGTLLADLGRPEDALAAVDRVLALDPHYAQAWNNRGIALQAQGRFEEALASYDHALALKPDYAAALFDRANILSGLKHFDQALAGYDGALALTPDDVRAWSNRGATLWAMNRIDEALASYGRALAIKPDDAEALHLRGNMLWAEKRDLGGAIRDLQTALRADPDRDYLWGDLLHLKMHAADWWDFEQQAAALEAAVRAGRRVVQPLYYLAISDAPAALQACASTYAGHLYPRAPAVWTGTRRRPGKIRIGYLCGEFREHPIGYLSVGLFEQHDKSRFEITALDSGWNDASPTRKRMEAAFDHFLDITKQTDKAAAEIILAGDIDILLDVNGYTRNHRIGVFAQRPAPLQVGYLGYPGTLGAPYMDYIIADRILIPEEQRRYYTENVVYLPGSYQANDSRRGEPEAAPRRAVCGLPELGFVFCNFNQSYKLIPEVFALWMRVLQKTEGSVLWLLESNRECSENLRREAEARGVAGERLIFAPLASLQNHMARLRLADLAIDTLPYNAHTTGSDALWAGVPLVTCRGRAFAGRVAASLLHAVGLPELVTDNPQDYEALILALAGDPARLGSIRSKLAGNRLRVPLFDTDRYRRQIETAYTMMWERLLRGELAQSFAVSAEAPDRENLKS